MRAARRFGRRPFAVASLLLLAGLIALAFLQSHVTPYQWDSIDLRDVATDRGPTFWHEHLFGTDQLGRDVFTRTIVGMHTTLEIGLAVAGLATAIGTPLGIVAGLYGGWLDALLMRVADFARSFPAVMLSLAAIVFFFPVWPHTMILVLGLYMWTLVARVVRTHVASLVELEFVEAARALGASDLRLIRTHLLPNVAGTVVVGTTAALAQAVLLEATIEFFSYGLPASRWPSLGNLLADVTFGGRLGLQGYRQLGWWTWTFPALVLALLLMTINFVGDELDAALNPLPSS
jgi:peptide/nickel transport system permease protein